MILDKVSTFRGTMTIPTPLVLFVLLVGLVWLVHWHNKIARAFLVLHAFSSESPLHSDKPDTLVGWMSFSVFVVLWYYTLLLSKIGFLRE